MTDDRRGVGPFVPAAAGAWCWQCANEAGVVQERHDPHFDSRQAAEDWLAEVFADLADDGVAAVTLFDGESAVYGPMSLEPPG